MLTNFIYAKSKAMFEERLDMPNEVPDDAIVFIEDTKEIWTHGHYYGCLEDLATKQDTLISGTNIKTINGESILGEGNIVVNVDTSNLATKEELATLQNEVIANEEVTAAALNDLNNRLGKLAENVQGETVTKEDFETAVDNVNNTILENEEITAAALVDLNTRLAALEAAIVNL